MYLIFLFDLLYLVGKIVSYCGAMYDINIDSLIDIHIRIKLRRCTLVSNLTIIFFIAALVINIIFRLLLNDKIDDDDA